MSEQQPSTSWASPAQTRVTFCTHKKSPKKRRETRTPFLSNRTLQRLDTRLPLKYRWASSPLVIGVVGYALRLTALGMMGCFLLAGGSCAVSTEAGSSSQKKDSSTPSKGRQPKLDKQPAADQIPGGIGGSVAVQQKVPSGPIGKTGVRGVPGGVLVTLPPRAK